jgi:hypothetical protein
LATALAGTATPQSVAADADVRCYAAITFAISGLSQSEAAKTEEMVGLTALAWYYYGRMQMTFPDTDFAPGVAELVGAPGYLTGQLREDAVRCGAEGEREGKAMESLGQRLQQMAPIAEHSAS